MMNIDGPFHGGGVRASRERSETEATDDGQKSPEQLSDHELVDQLMEAHAAVSLATALGTQQVEPIKAVRDVLKAELFRRLAERKAHKEATSKIIDTVFEL